MAYIIQNNDRERFFNAIKIAGIFTAIIWVVHLIQWFSPLDFTNFGILPQTTEGIKGIFFSPFLHSQDSWGHILNNTPTLFAGILMLYYFYSRVANRALIYIYLFTGLAVWWVAGYTGGRWAYHIGASGVVYGLISFIFFSGIFRKNKASIILSLIVILMYSGMVAGLFPDAEGKISWQSHLMGAVFGAVLAHAYKDVKEPYELAEMERRKISSEPIQPFLPRDIFDKTKEERKNDNDDDISNKGGWIQDKTW